MGLLDALRGDNNDVMRHSTSVTMAYLLAQNRKFEAFMGQKAEELEARVAAQQARLSTWEVDDLAEVETLLPAGDEVAVSPEDWSGDLNRPPGPSEVGLSGLVAFETTTDRLGSGQARTVPETGSGPQESVQVSDTIPSPTSETGTDGDHPSHAPATMSPPEPQDWLAALIGTETRVPAANPAIRAEEETQVAAADERTPSTRLTEAEITVLPLTESRALSSSAKAHRPLTATGLISSTETNDLPLAPTDSEAATSDRGGPLASPAPVPGESGPPDDGPTFIPSWMQVSPAGTRQSWPIHGMASTPEARTLLVESNGKNTASEADTVPAAKEKAGDSDDDDDWETLLNDGPVEDWG